MSNGKYYVIRRKYVGPNLQDRQWIDYAHVVVTDTPAQYNSAKQLCVEGWAGTTSDIAVFAHGVYDTEDAAIKAAEEWLGSDFRALNPPQDYATTPEETVFAAYKPGRYIPMTRSESFEWSLPLINKWVTANAPVDEARDLVSELQGAAAALGYKLASGLEDDILDYVTTPQS